MSDWSIPFCRVCGRSMCTDRDHTECYERAARKRADLSKVTRVVVVDADHGRTFDRILYPENVGGVKLLLQDDGRTLKVFPRTTSSERQ